MLQEGQGVSEIQVLISVAKKNVKRASDRNLLKRRMREAYRLNKHPLIEKTNELQGKVLLGFIYTSNDIIDFKTIEKEVTSLLSLVSDRITKNSG
jgi:ribonuclease P protein component